MKAINIDECKVVRREGHLWLYSLISIPLNYQCTNITVTPVFYTPSYMQGSPLVFETELDALIPGEMTTIEVGVDDYWGVPISASGIYHVEIECSLTDLTLGEEWPRELNAEMYISDVEFVYNCIIPNLLKLCGHCTTIPDSLIQQYIMLKGHEMALQYKDLPTAEYLYKKMLNCGNPCKTIDLDCGCHGKH